MLSTNVTKVLKSSKTANKSNAKLYYNVLRRMKLNPKEMTAAELLNGMANGKFPSFDTVSRMARKVKNSNNQ